MTEERKRPVPRRAEKLRGEIVWSGATWVYKYRQVVTDAGRARDMWSGGSHRILAGSIPKNLSVH